MKTFLNFFRALFSGTQFKVGNRKNSDTTKISKNKVSGNTININTQAPEVISDIAVTFQPKNKLNEDLAMQISSTLKNYTVYTTSDGDIIVLFHVNTNNVNERKKLAKDIMEDILAQFGDEIAHSSFEV